MVRSQIAYFGGRGEVACLHALLLERLVNIRAEGREIVPARAPSVQALLTPYLPMRQVRDSLTARAKEFNILVDDIAITHLSFGTEARSSSALHPAVLPRYAAVCDSPTATLSCPGLEC